jgi:two-component system sensor histidine kinase/response regulator
MDGFECAQQITQDRSRPGPASIMLTSAGTRGDSARCKEVGIQAYLSKPIKRSDLLQTIKIVLGSDTPSADEKNVLTIHSLKETRGRLKILLAEDNRVNQRLAVGLLEKRGHVVTVAQNGVEVLQSLEKQTPDLILMDVQMPEMDGFETTVAIRAGERKTGKHIPIVALTARAMSGDRERCEAAGMDGYVSKPLQAETFFAAIEEVLAKLRIT